MRRLCHCYIFVCSLINESVWYLILKLAAMTLLVQLNEFEHQRTQDLPFSSSWIMSGKKSIKHYRDLEPMICQKQCFAKDKILVTLKPTSKSESLNG